MIREAKIQVLIADDHRIVREGIKTILDNIDDIMIAGEAENGEDAVNFVKENKIDVVLMDIDMPHLNGIDASKQIMSFSSTTKIIALSMHNNQVMLNKMLSAGAKGYLLKNTDSQTLIFTIRNISKGMQMIDGAVQNIQKSTNYNNVTATQTNLTKREVEILQNIAQGATNKEISEQLFISPKTVDTHRTTIMRKLNIHNTAGLVRYAISNGII